MHIQKRITTYIVTLFIFAQFAFVVLVPRAEAAIDGLDTTSMRPDRMIDSATTQYLLVIEPKTTATETNTVVTFATGYGVASANVNTTGIGTAPLDTWNGTALSALPTATLGGVSGQDVTINHGDLTVGTLYGVYITNVDNPATPNQYINYVVTNDGTTDIDSGAAAVDIVTDNSGNIDEDQIIVTARVAPSYNITLDSNAITLDAFAASVEYPGAAGDNSGVSPVKVSVETNASSGHVLWLKTDDATGLTSSTTGQDITWTGAANDDTVSSLTAGTIGAVVDVDIETDTSGSLAIAAEYDGVAVGNNDGGTPDTVFREIASATGPVTSSPGDEVNIIPRVAIDSTLLAATDYNNTLTVVGAGEF